MIEDSFKIRYKSVPLAVHIQKDNDDTHLHNHEEYEIILITSGLCVVSINDKSFRARKGDLIFINPMEVHAIAVSDEEPFSHVCICFDCSLIHDQKITEELRNEVLHIRHHVEATHACSTLFSQLLLQAVEAHESDSGYVKMEVTSYLSLLFAGLLKNGLVDHEVKKSKGTLFCTEVLQYISAHYTEQITSKEAAEALSYNQSYFCRNFRKNFASCFADYLNRYRVSASRQFLETGEKSIAEVATLCGFQTPAHFSKCFKKHVGILPSKYKGSDLALTKVNADQKTSQLHIFSSQYNMINCR